MLELQLILDADMYLFFERAMRGGVSFIFKRYSKATKKYLIFMTQNKNKNISCTQMQINYMTTQCLNFFQQTVQIDRP